MLVCFFPLRIIADTEAIAMASIRIISTTTIQARSPIINGDSSPKIELNPWDLQFLPIESAQKGFLFRKPKSEDGKTTLFLIQHLKDSLSSTLDFFPPLAGRLAVVHHNDSTSSVFIACNNAGASFVYAVAEKITVADILEPIYVPPVVNSFYPLVGVKNFQGISKPLLAVQVTELVDGIFMGLSINHCLVDVTSFFHFFNSWAEISRNGLDHGISKPPSFERWFPDGIQRPIRIPFRALVEQRESDQHAAQPPPKRIFYFTKEKVAELKAKANSDMSTNQISSLQAVISHVWRSFIRNQHLHPEEEVNYILAISTKSRIHPPLPENYFGSAMQIGVVTMKAGELLDDHGGLGKVAWEMNKMVSKRTDEKLKRDYESWAKNPRFHFPGLRGRIGKALGTSSSPRLNFYSIDFGWGRLIAIGSGVANKRNGRLTADAGVEEGSMEIEVCISYEILEAMGRDPEFMAAVAQEGLSNKLLLARL